MFLLICSDSGNNVCLHDDCTPVRFHVPLYLIIRFCMQFYIADLSSKLLKNANIKEKLYSAFYVQAPKKIWQVCTKMPTGPIVSWVEAGKSPCPQTLQCPITDNMLFKRHSLRSSLLDKPGSDPLIGSWCCTQTTHCLLFCIYSWISGIGLLISLVSKTSTFSQMNCCYILRFCFLVISLRIL